MLGLLTEGVGGISRVGRALFLPPVCSVRARVLGLRLGGVGGFTKEGDDGAEEDGGAFCTDGRFDAVAGRPKPSDPDVLTARFFRFRGFLAGVVGRCSSKK